MNIEPAALKQLLPHDIRALDGLLRTGQGPDGLASLQVRLEPIDADGETVCTFLRLDGIPGLGDDLLSCAGRRLSFPVNPSDGYIDGSIYFASRHHPVDVTEMRFGAPGASLMPLHLQGLMSIDDDGTPRVVPVSLSVPVHLPLSERQIHALVEAAMSDLGTKRPSDLGRLMAHVKPAVRYVEQLGEVSAVARRLLAAAARA